MRPRLPLLGLLLACALTTAPRLSLAQRSLETFSGKVTAVTNGITSTCSETAAR